MTNLSELLNALDIKERGRYDNQYYIIKLQDSNEYAKMYSQLDKLAINTEYPYFEQNTNKSLKKVMNYFEYSLNDADYKLFLIADFENNVYFLKIGEK